MRTENIDIRYPGKIARAYIDNFPEVEQFFEYNPFSSSEYKRRFDDLMIEYKGDREKLVSILYHYNKGLGCGEKTLDNLMKLIDQDTVVVITGQQAGILTGPLYTIYKAITTIQLAKKVESEQGIKVVPLFWVASEDHDYDEIDHMDFLNKNQEVYRLKLNYTPGGKIPTGNMSITHAVYELLDLLSEQLNPSEWKDEIIGFMRQSAAEAGNLADWFAKIMTWLFKNQGLIMVNPMDYKLKNLLADTFVKFVSHADEINAKLAEGREKVIAFGAEPQVTVMENSINLFYLLNGERIPLLKKGNDIFFRGTDEVLDITQLLACAKGTPSLLSPNVVLRPIAQDVLFPILAYVAGPGEIAYYSLYKGIYPLFDQKMPIIYPRTNVTLLERSVAKNIEKYDLDLAQGVEGLRSQKEQFLLEQDKVGIDPLFENAQKAVVGHLQELISKIKTIDPQLEVQGQEALNKIHFQLEQLHKKSHQYHRKGLETTLNRFKLVENNLYPMRNWQERVFNIIPYLVKYGPTAIDDLTDLPLISDFTHKAVYL